MKTWGLERIKILTIKYVGEGIEGGGGLYYVYVNKLCDCRISTTT